MHIKTEDTKKCEILAQYGKIAANLARGQICNPIQVAHIISSLLTGAYKNGIDLDELVTACACHSHDAKKSLHFFHSALAMCRRQSENNDRSSIESRTIGEYIRNTISKQRLRNQLRLIS